MTNQLFLIAAIVYCVVAAADIALCVSGQYTRRGVTYPAFVGFYPKGKTYVALLFAQHSFIILWILDKGAFGQSELPGYLASWLGFDALARMWKLRSK